MILILDYLYFSSKIFARQNYRPEILLTYLKIATATFTRVPTMTSLTDSDDNWKTFRVPLIENLSAHWRDSNRFKIETNMAKYEWTIRTTGREIDIVTMATATV